MGLSESEMTLGELCKQKDYATACFGKWHLGTALPEFLPPGQGFDHYYGLPCSNDMWPLHPAYADLPADPVKRKEGYPELPIYYGIKIVDDSVSGEDQEQLTTEYTRRSVEIDVEVDED